MIQTKQIHIPGHPDAFNPSLLAWGDGWLLSFRDKECVSDVWHSRIGLVKLNALFEVTGSISFLDTGSHLSADPRLIQVNETTYIVYSDVSLEALRTGAVEKKHILEVVVGKIEEDKQIDENIITCECGIIIKKSSKTAHLKTKKHADLLEKIKNKK